MKYIFRRSAPKELVYRDHKNFDRVIFKIELEDKINLDDFHLIGLIIERMSSLFFISCFFEKLHCFQSIYLKVSRGIYNHIKDLGWRPFWQFSKYISEIYRLPISKFKTVLPFKHLEKCFTRNTALWNWIGVHLQKHKHVGDMQNI